MPKKRARVAGLGQQIFTPGDLAEAHPIDTISSNEGRLIRIPVDQIEPNPEQPRQHFSREALRELADSIKDRGLIQPIVVEEKGERFMILAGERRWRAARLAGVARIDAIVRKAGSDPLVVAIIENALREDLNPVEHAEALQKLASRGMTNREIAGLLHKSESVISETLTITRLPEDLKTEVRSGATNLPRSTLAKIATLESEEAMRELFEQARTGELTVRQARKAIKKSQGGRPSNYTFRWRAPKDAYEVQVRFKKARVSQAEVREALKAAIARLK